MKNICFLLCLLLGMAVQAQIKIGDNPQNIDPSSVLELESSSRVLVITRVNTAQMNTITPSAGALVYNTDVQCIHYYTGTEWKDICDAVAGSITFTSDDGTVVITSTGGNNYDLKVGQITGMNIVNETVFGADIATATIGERQLAPNSVGSSELQDNTVGKAEIQEAAVGTLEIIDGTIQPSDMQPGAVDQVLTTNTAGNVVWLNKNELGATQADQTTITGAGTAADPIKVADTVIGDILANTNSITVNSNNIAQNTNDITAINTALGTKEDVANKSDDTALGNSTTLYPTQNAVKTYVDQLAGAASTLADGNIFVGSAGNVATGVAMGGDATISNTGDVTIADLAITSPKIALNSVGTPHLANNAVTAPIIFNGAVTNGKLDKANIPLSGFGAAVANVDIGNNKLINVATPTLALDGVNKSYVDALVGGSAQTIVSEDTPPNSITAGTDGGAYYVDGDGDNTNEIISTAILSGTDLIITEAGTPFTVDLSTLAGTGTDNQSIQGSGFVGNILTIGIQNGTSEDVNLSDLEESADITANTALINGHISSDGDLDDTNETISSAILSGTDLVITEAGTPFTVDLSTLGGTGTDNQNIQGSSFAGNTLTIGIEDGTSQDVDLSALEESADIAANTTLINNHITADGDLDDTNEIELPPGGTSGQVLSTNGLGTYSWATITGGGVDTNDFITGGNLTGSTLNLTGTGAAGASIDISDLEESADIAANTTLINNHITADGDLSDTNEIQTISSPDASVTVTPVGNNYELIVAGGTDNQNIQGSSFAGNTLTIGIEDGTSQDVDLSALEESADITANTTLINNHITADGDLSDTNEIQTISSPDASVTVTPVGNNYELIVAGGTDNQNIQGSSFAGNILTIGIEDGTSQDVDLSALEESADITANTTLINNHITADGDLSDTNEIQTISSPDASVTVTPVGNNYELIVAGGTDNQNIQGSSFAGNTLTIGIEDGTSQDVDLSALEESADITANTTLINNHITADGDLSDTNEIQTISSPDASVTVTPVGNNYELIVAGGTDNQNIQGSSFAGNTLTIGIEDGTSQDVDLSALEESADITANTTLINNHITADGDLSDTNEIQTISSPDASVTVTPVGNNYELIVAGGTDNQNIQGSSFAGNTLTIGIEDGTSQDVDLSALEESADITANTTLINNHITADGDLSDTNEIQTISSPDASVTVTPVGNNYELIVAGGTDNQNIQGSSFAGNILTIGIEDGTSQDVDLSALEESADITANTTLINNHITADGDLSDTNEIQTISSPDASVTVTPVGNNYELIVAGGTDNQNIQGSSFAGNTLTIGIEDGTSQDVDLSALEESADITANTTLINNHITADGDLSDTNEIQPITSTDNSIDIVVSGIGFDLSIASSSISGSQVDPAFGSQNISTTGTLAAGNTTVTGNLNVSASVIVGGATVHPDYVFQKYFLGNSVLKENYDFQTLEQIEAFVKKHHHLPGIQSSAEIKAQGFWDLGQASKLNLEKIEELFLHTIEQEKKIDQLKTENQSLSAELQSLRKDMDEIKALLQKQ